MKPAGRTILLGILMLWISVLVCAEPVSQLHPTDYVNDFAHVLDQTTIAQLDNICQQIDQKAHAQIAVVTINSLEGSDIESYAVDLFHKWGVGSKAANRGVLILLAVKDHRYRIEVGYGLEPILPDGKVGGFGREAVSLLRQNDYNGAVLLLTSRVANVIAQDAGVQLTGAQASADAADGNFRRRDSPTCNSYFGCIVYSAQAVDILVAFVWRPRIRWAQRRRMGRRRIWRRRWIWRIWRRQFRRRRSEWKLVGRSDAVL